MKTDMEILESTDIINMLELASNLNQQEEKRIYIKGLFFTFKNDAEFDSIGVYCNEEHIVTFNNNFNGFLFGLKEIDKTLYKAIN
jgi:hypothetical protein